MDSYKVSVVVEFTISGENLSIAGACTAAGDKLRAIETPLTVTDIYAHRMEAEQEPVPGEGKQRVREEWTDLPGAPSEGEI